MKWLPESNTNWALDSGGFSELSMYGEWRTSAEEYIVAVKWYQQLVGKLDWAAPQDWMCEPHILSKTGKTIQYHQDATVDNYLQLKEANDIFIPVLQGWQIDDYLRHIEMYEAKGVNCSELGTVGLGSICRRQGTTEILNLIKILHARQINIHAFGVKTEGLRYYGQYLQSADSMAWSAGARLLERRLPGHTHKHCGNCLEYALKWRDNVLAGC